MSFIAQKTFNPYQEKGQIGSISRPSQPFLLDNNGYVAGEDLKPSFAVYKKEDGKYYRPSADTTPYVIGVVHYVPHKVNTPIDDPTDNMEGEIIVPKDSDFEIVTSGHVYVRAGESIAKDEPAAFDPSDNSWKKATKLEYANPMFFEEAGEKGDIVSMRIAGMVRTLKDVEKADDLI